MSTHLNLVAFKSSMGPIRQSSTAWARDFQSTDGEIVRLFGYRDMPSPNDWWSHRTTAAKMVRHQVIHSKKSLPPTSPTPTQPSRIAVTLKRKRVADSSKCEKPPSKRTRPSSLLACLPPAPAPGKSFGESTRVLRSITKARSRSQNDTDRLNEQVPLDNTIPNPPSNTLPNELAGHVPDFSKTGAHCCGSHKRPFRAPNTLTCRDCQIILPYGSMHALPCGHALCRTCLNDNVAQTRATLNSRRAWKQVQELRDQHENYVALNNGPEGDLDFNIPSPSQTATHQPLQPSEYFDQVLALLNLWCCGMDTSIGDFHECMEPENSAATWLVDQLLQDTECLPLEGEEDDEFYNRCGWPDCQSLLTSACRFKRDSSPDSSLTYHYCMQCGGVSLTKSHWDNIPSWV